VYYYIKYTQGVHVRFLLALSVLLFSACDAYVEVPADMVGENPINDFPVFVKMNGVVVSPLIPQMGSEPFSTMIKVPRPDANDPSAIDDRTTAGFNFVNTQTGEDLSASVRCRIGAKITTHVIRLKTKSGEGVRCAITNY
jgi:hypothetical protein